MKYFCYITLGVLFIVASLHLFVLDFYYDTDIARDMLLLEDMAEQQKVSLIGGRSSIPGVFHGPLYYWLLLPFFFISGGNPIVISWVWFIIYLLFLSAFFYVSNKVFNKKIALISTTFLASTTITYSNGFTHTVLANFLIVPFIYLTYKYLQSNKFPWLICATFTAGLLIQFQMAFGVPVLILISSYITYHIISKRNFTHLLAGLMLLIPLSTFIFFDIRHNFIQLNSVLDSFTNDSGNNFNGYWTNRWSSFIDSFRVWYIPIEELQNFVQVSVALLLGALTWYNLKTGKKSNKFITLATLIIFGFWFITSPFKGNVWPQYYRTLLPLVVLCLTYFITKYIPKKISLSILIILIGSNTLFALKASIDYLQSYSSNEIRWQFHKQLADDIIANSNKEEFGYYIFTPDQFGYQIKYAMNYQTKINQVQTQPYTKLPLTYLIQASYWDDTRLLTKEHWRNNQVKITRNPDETWAYYNNKGEIGYTVMRYELSQKEATISADPNLIDGIHFR